MSQPPRETKGERRSEERERQRLEVRIQVDVQELAGTTVDRSPHGVLFVTEDDLRVEVEVAGQGKRHGRLVRAVGVGGETQAWAIALDPEDGETDGGE